MTNEYLSYIKLIYVYVIIWECPGEILHSVVFLYN